MYVRICASDTVTLLCLFCLVLVLFHDDHNLRATGDLDQVYPKSPKSSNRYPKTLGDKLSNFLVLKRVTGRGMGLGIIGCSMLGLGYSVLGHEDP